MESDEREISVIIIGAHVSKYRTSGPPGSCVGTQPQQGIASQQRRKNHLGHYIRQPSIARMKLELEI